MHIAVRPYITAGVALVGASVIAAAPIATPVSAPDVKVPAVHTAEVQLAAATIPGINLILLSPKIILDVSPSIFSNNDLDLGFLTDNDLDLGFLTDNDLSLLSGIGLFNDSEINVANGALSNLLSGNLSNNDDNKLLSGNLSGNTTNLLSGSFNNLLSGSFNDTHLLSDFEIGDVASPSVELFSGNRDVSLVNLLSNNRVKDSLNFSPSVDVSDNLNPRLSVKDVLNPRLAVKDVLNTITKTATAEGGSANNGSQTTNNITKSDKDHGKKPGGWKR